MPGPKFTKTVPTSNKARLAVLDEIVEFTRENGLQTELDAYEFYLIVDEAVTNSMEHGNRWGEEKTIDIDIHTEDNQLVIRIKDQGIGFNPDYVAKNLPGRSKTLSPRGRGIFIIKKFCQVSWNNIGNEVTLRVGLKK